MLLLKCDDTNLTRSAGSKTSKCFAEKDAGVSSSTGFTDFLLTTHPTTAEGYSQIGLSSRPAASAGATIYPMSSDLRPALQGRKPKKRTKTDENEKRE